MPGKTPGLARYKVQAIKVGNRIRYGIANEELARAAAKGQTTKAINRQILPEEYRTSSSRQMNFKRGVSNMASRMGTKEQQELIDRMDANKLDALYKHNKIVFDVYFSYEGATSNGETVIKGEQNVKNTQFLIEQYERAYGKL